MPLDAEVVFGPAGQGEPRLYWSLVAGLGLTGAADEEIRSAIDRWLSTNTPSPSLADSLERHGLMVDSSRGPAVGSARS